MKLEKKPGMKLRQLSIQRNQILISRAFGESGMSRATPDPGVSDDEGEKKVKTLRILEDH